ncbi:MAG: hypothetical protein HY961_07465 [Ignavibacteriae bacterium]|nr:hypothetical protein [Ignavibacteriota bacterium]
MTSAKSKNAECDEEAVESNLWTGREPTAEDLFMQREKWKCFLACVKRLDSKYRIPFIMSDLRGMADKEIAKTLRLSNATVKIRLHRARAKLRSDIESHCGLIRDSRNNVLWEGKRL